MTTAAAASPPTQLPTAQASAPSTSSANHIHTYHCLCTQLLLASTTPLTSLPRRGGDTEAAAPLDRSYILPLPAPPTSSTSSDSTVNTATTAAAAAAASECQSAEDAASSPHYALTLSLTGDRTPLIIQRDDGLEKRYLARCGRCRVVVGYWLDWSQFGGASATASVSGTAATAKTSGRRDNIVYLLPGGLLSTQDMVAGKKIGEGKGA